VYPPMPSLNSALYKPGRMGLMRTGRTENASKLSWTLMAPMTTLMQKVNRNDPMYNLLYL